MSSVVWNVTEHGLGPHANTTLPPNVTSGIVTSTYTKFTTVPTVMSSKLINALFTTTRQSVTNASSTTSINILSTSTENHVLDDDYEDEYHESGVTNATFTDLNIYEDDVTNDSSSSVGVGVGVAIGLAVLLALTLAIIIVIVRKRKRREREKNIVRIENPKYVMEEEKELTIRRPPTFDLTAHIEPTVRYQVNNNASFATNGGRKKEAPAPPPIYKPNNNKADAASKRAAPSPPRALSPPRSLLEPQDLYEKDSNAGSVETLTSPFTASNQNAEIIEADSSHRPLLDDSFKPDKQSPEKHSPKKPSRYQPITRQDSDEPELPEEQVKDHAALLKKEKERSNLSLDSYDKTKNPFFSDS